MPARLINRDLHRRFVTLQVFLILCLCGCSSTSAPSRRFKLEGTVVLIDNSSHQVMIDGKDVPGCMSAMTMAYTVKDDRALNELRKGDSITATIVVSDAGSWL